ncbi:MULTISPECIES: hypothetical protein [Actinopolyspora]|uniref:YGGT family protein n=1 Tax=Actinopolyspora saharensis TaxID=995062 RepID=A0A1H1FCN9_9ACTN|nr:MULTISPECIES: hypothetical protein [Actinopolyspora]NHD19232.1 hypothetical protein [Actinopolyspora sp. BKK2]NHE78356.1 hypothetical protein [Actinopolyspora sp. BKK1]SDQ98660.1 hypothetical protein SAMN04489718_2966 [Actinopolyspora saharensis]
MSEEVASSTRSGKTESSPGGHRRRGSFDFAAARARFFGVLATVVRWGCTLAAALSAAHVVFTLGGANPDNALTRFVSHWAETVALGFQDLFLKPAEPELEVLLNYGSAALFWLLVSGMSARILHALGGRSG